jgi:hypothetical protein
MNRIRLGFVCVLSTLIAAGCGMPLAEYTEEIKGGPTEENPSSPDGPGEPSVPGGVSVITNYDLQAYVPVPTTGAVPVTEIAGRVDMAGVVNWMNQEGKKITGDFPAFDNGETYQAVIDLTAMEGYSFVPAVSFMYYPAKAVADQSNPDTAAEDKGRTQLRSVTITYNPTTQANLINTAIDLTSQVPAPVPGKTPVTYFSPGLYSGIVVWQKSGGTAHSGPFQANTAYTATVTLYPVAGYIFPASVPVTHGSLTVNDFTDEPRKGTIEFPQSGDSSAGIEVGW